MPWNRFQSIIEFLHFKDNTFYNPNNPDRDWLYKISLVVEYFVSKSETLYTPEQHAAIDEELLLWKGRLGFKHYIPSKRARFGIKMFSLCEVPSYLWSTFVYIGKDLPAGNDELQKELGKSGAVIPKLKQDLYGKGYHTYVDNWYTSEKLFDHLERN